MNLSVTAEREAYNAAERNERKAYSKEKVLSAFELFIPVSSLQQDILFKIFYMILVKYIFISPSV